MCYCKKRYKRLKQAFEIPSRAVFQKKMTTWNLLNEELHSDKKLRLITVIELEMCLINTVTKAVPRPTLHLAVKHVGIKRRN